MHKNLSLSIFIDSFDGYRDLWNNFFTIFDHYWSECAFEKYLVCNTTNYEHSRTTLIKTGEEIDWFQRTIKAIECIHEDYILFMLEDYFISEKICNDDLLEILKCMEENKIFYYRLSPNQAKPENSHCFYTRVASKGRYQISLQMAIWNRGVFLELLKKIQSQGGKSPWDFEKYFVNQFQEDKVNKFVPGILYDTRDLLGYKNGVLQGKWIRSTLKFYKKQGFLLDTGEREIMSLKSTISYKLKSWGAKHVPVRFVSHIRNFMRRVGFNFITD